MAFNKLKAHPLYQPLLLGVVTLLASAALALAARATQEAILEAEARDLRASLTQVLPVGFADNDLLADQVEVDVGAKNPLRVYRARQGDGADNSVRGVVFKVVGQGYGGEIQILMAINRDAQILGVRVLKHTETPGLGDKIEAAKSHWIAGFIDKTLATANWAVKKDGGDFDQFAGATITPRAVVKAVKEGLETFARHKTALLGEPEEKSP
ncbi:MAG: RnfABCDGE type electron transport complex subunit G [Zoogloeaceae bacterium]|jgi:electron transport complex protein RnfG|nr:RnfABCDGE type electron transport complex subunit G [Zoogloeaceae bacterium]